MPRIKKPKIKWMTRQEMVDELITLFVDNKYYSIQTLYGFVKNGTLGLINYSNKDLFDEYISFFGLNVEDENILVKLKPGQRPPKKPRRK